MAGNVHVAEKDNNVPIYLALSIHAAKETDSIVGSRVGSDSNVLEKVHVIGIGMGMNGGRRKSSTQQSRGKDSFQNHVRLSTDYAARRPKVPGT
jgi:hypothetical protein